MPAQRGVAVETDYGPAWMHLAYLLLRYRRDGTSGTLGSSPPPPPPPPHDSVGSTLRAGCSCWRTGPDRPRGKRTARPREIWERANLCAAAEAEGPSTIQWCRRIQVKTACISLTVLTKCGDISCCASACLRPILKLQPYPASNLGAVIPYSLRHDSQPQPVHKSLLSFCRSLYLSLRQSPLAGRFRPTLHFGGGRLWRKRTIRDRVLVAKKIEQSKDGMTVGPKLEPASPS